MDDTIALAALIQAIVSKLYKLQRQNLSFRIYRRRLLDENRWRACRYGLDGKLIDFGARERGRGAQPAPRVAGLRRQRKWTNSAAPRQIAHVETILREGTGADRQLDVWERTGGNMRAVMDHITARDL